MRKKQFAARVWAKLMAYERKAGLLKQGDRILAAVSGGPDSVCLAHYLASARKRLGFSLCMMHVDHGLRGLKSKADAAFTRKFGHGLGMKVFVTQVPAARRAALRGKGIEDAARELRYKALSRAARKNRCNKVATGHQMDDQAETVLLHLLRGTRLKALSGIPPRRTLTRGIELIRPLLPLTRREVLDYLKIHGLSYRKDSSNLDVKFLRNWIRRKVLPLLESRNPRIREHLSGIAEQARAINEKAHDSQSRNPGMLRKWES